TGDVELAADGEQLLAVTRALLQRDELLLQLGVQAGILDRHRHAARKRLEEGEVIVGEGAATTTVHDLDHADRPVPRAEGSRQEAPRPDARLTVGPGAGTRVGVGIV